jgi:hypothetical protein
MFWLLDLIDEMLQQYDAGEKAAVSRWLRLSIGDN